MSNLFKSVVNATNTALQAVNNPPKNANTVKPWIDEKQFSTMFKRARPSIFAEMMKQMPLAGCKTREQQAMFIAQCAVETGGFSAFSENLNYSADSLLRVFPKYFNQKNVSLYARNPQAIANRCYANRMGNGSEQSGDGWKYRGRGLIQITGKYNYVEFAKWANLPSLVTSPDQILQSNALIVQTAVWYWTSRKLADFGGDLLTVTKKINGGTHGLSARQKYFQELMSL